MRTVSTLLLGFRDGNSFSRLAFDDLANLPYETCLITFIHPTKWEQYVHLTIKLISNKTRIDPVARDGLLFLESSRLVCSPPARRDENCSSFLFAGCVSSADNPRALRLSRSPRRYTSFRDTAPARSTRPSRCVISRHLTVSSPPAPSAFAVPARGSCPPTRAPRGRQRWRAARP